MLVKQLLPFGKPTDYAETSQANPIRYVVYYKNEDGTYQAQTNEFKCKDFFNDMVAWYHGIKFRRYGMDFREFNLNDEGVYVELRNLKPTFLDNMKVVLGEEFKVFGAEVTFENIGTRKTSLMAFIPRKFFSCTYFISYLTVMLRNCNWDVSYSTPEDIFSYSGSDSLLRTSKTIMNKWPLKDQPWFTDYWYYYRPEINSSTPWIEGSYDAIVHNNGVVDWSRNLPRLSGEPTPQSVFA
jgi:hypothetical protein